MDAQMYTLDTSLNLVYLVFYLGILDSDFVLYLYLII